MKSNSGITLVELIVATMISTVVIMGLFTMMSAVQNSSSGMGKSAYIDGSVRATVNDIIRNANTTVGSGVLEKGVLIGTSDGLTDGTFCLAQDITNPPDATRDNWICYTQIGTNIYKCTQGANAAAACTAGNLFVGTAVANSIAVGNPANTPIFPITANSNQFTITITSRVDPTTPNSSRNKEVAVTDSVTISGHSI